MTKPPAISRNLPFMCLLSFAVGIIAGLGAWAFRMLIGFVHNILFLGKFQCHYDANIHTPGSPWGPWVILVPVVGALLVSWLVKTFAPEAKGHGVPEVMDAIYYNDSKIRPVVGFIKAVASAICIGSGGSVGREGPIIQIGASFGSTLGQILRLPPRQIVTLIAAGAAGGIAATFNAPLGGLIFAIELLLVSINARNVLPVTIASVTATYIGRALLGVEPSFYFPALTPLDLHLSSIGNLLLFVPFGIIMGLVSTLFVRGIYWAEDRFDAMPGNTYTRHLSAMFAVGVMIWLFMRYTGYYYVQGVGYATIMDIIKTILLNPWLLMLLFFSKFVATCLTLGSGGSGGVFSPSLFMGATMGALMGHSAATLFPGIGIDPVDFAIAGMAAGVGSSTGAVITGAVMILEMTQDANVVMPIMITSAFAYGIRKWLSPGSIYTLKLLRRGHIVPEGLQAAMSESMTVQDIMVKTYTTVDADAALKPSETPVLVTSGDAILGVVPPHIAGSRAQLVVSHQYIMTPEKNPVNDLLREMHTTGAKFALVTGTPGTPMPHEIIGIVAEREVAASTMKEAELK
jgi:chloride channel protein, CIC family